MLDMGAAMKNAKDVATEEVEDIKVSRRMADKDRTLARRQARQMKNFMRNNG
jgi:hypothetical protein